jgi:hypothetical protein
MRTLLTALACLTTATADPVPTVAPSGVRFDARSLLAGDGLFPTLRPPTDTPSPLERLTLTPWGTALGEHPNPAPRDYWGGSSFGLKLEF